MKTTIVRILRAVAAALDEDVPLEPPVGRFRVAIEEAPPGTPVPPPFTSDPEPDSHMAAANRILARIYLRQALRRYSPEEKPNYA